MKQTPWLLFSLLLLTSTTAKSAPVYGDADGDGSVTIADAVRITQVAAGIRGVDDTVRRNGDVSPVNNYASGSFGDGKIGLDDAVRVWRRVNGLSTAEWPAVVTYYPLEAGNVYATREYDSSGNETTGPTWQQDPTATTGGPTQETVNGVTYTIYTEQDSDGEMSKLTAITDAVNGRSVLAARHLEISGADADFDPPLILLEYPVQGGTSWGPYTTTASSPDATITFTYNGTTTGPVAVTTPAGTFDNAQMITLTYSSGTFGPSGTEWYWFVPFLGPVQHGYTHKIPFVGISTINPRERLSHADIHGVIWP